MTLNDAERLNAQLRHLEQLFFVHSPELPANTHDLVSNFLSRSSLALSLHSTATNQQDRENLLKVVRESLESAKPVLSMGLDPIPSSLSDLPLKFVSDAQSVARDHHLIEPHLDPIFRHDLRNYYTAMLGGLRLAADDPHDRELGISLAQSAIAHFHEYLSRAISDIKTPVSLHDFISHSRDELSRMMVHDYPVTHKFNRKHMGFNALIPVHHFRASVKGLIDNAVREMMSMSESNRHPLVVRYRVLKDFGGRGPDFLEVRVNDRGPGFSKKGLKRLDEELGSKMIQTSSLPRGLQSIHQFAKSEGGCLFHKTSTNKGSLLFFRIRLQRV
jgi:hypothetical protein